MNLSFSDKKGLRSRLRGLIISTALIIICIVAGNSFVLTQLRQNALQNAQASLLRQSLTLSETVDRAFQAVNLVLESVADKISHSTLTDSDFHQLGTQEFHDLLKERLLGLAQLDALGIIDAKGRRINNSRQWPNVEVDVSHREYFEAAKKSPKPVTFVGKPVRSISTNTWVIVLARPVLTTKGKFLGVVFGSITLKYYEDFFRSTSLGDGYAATLMRTDGTLLARYPVAGTIGSIASASVLKRIANSNSGVSRSISPVDHQARIAAARRLTSYPLVVITTQTDQAAFGAWRETAFRTGVTAAAMILIIIVAAFLIARSWRQQERLNVARAEIIESDKIRALAEAELLRQHDLAQQNLRFNAAVENMQQGLCVFDASQRLVICNKQYAELYGLSEEQTKPGTSLREILKHRLVAGDAPVDYADYVEDRLREISLNRPYQITNRLGDGRYVSIVHRPTADGGWVATHEDITERKQKEESFSLLFKSNPVPMWVSDRESLRFLAVNDAALARYGYSREHFMAITVPDLRPAAEQEGFAAFLRSLPDDQFAENIGQHRTSDGSIIDVAVYSRALVYEGHHARLTVVHDVTTTKRAESELRRVQNFLDAVIEHVPVPIIVKDVSGLESDASSSRFTLFNRAYEELTGESRGQLIGKTAHELFPNERATLIVQSDNEALLSNQVVITSEHTIHTSHNGARMVTAKKTLIRDENGKPQHLLTVVDDVTERRRAEQRIAHMAHFDNLTDLPNRATFNETIAATLEKAAANNEQFAILNVDLDRFKDANDQFGHSVGDALLREVTRRLHEAAAGVFIARIGGDEFTLIVTDGEQPAAAMTLAQRLIAAFTSEFEVEGRQLRVGLSVGGAVYPTDGTDAKTLMVNADAALYRAKAEARGSALFFEPEMRAQLSERLALQEDLRSAIARGELFLHYQPQVKMTGEIIGFEALIRWLCPKRGMVPPGTFIPIAEESGQIVAIGEWVLREACREAASWPKSLTVAINISPIQVHHGDLPGLVHSILLDTGLAPSRLELEITEGVLIDEFSRAVSILRRLKSLGVQIALDDFGTGYSSLSYLHSFSFDRIKIDRAFISDLEHNRHSMAIVRAVIGLGQSLGVPTLAEGVETEIQHAFLVQENCDAMQGYLTGRPQPIAEYAKLTGCEAASERIYATAG
jgi:diguanylate cyclase (GGDEF)-like protein/PAS domain S-box-containing protein